MTILNAQGAALLGVDAEEARGLPLPDVLRLLDQDGRTWLDVNRPFDAISITRGVPEQSWLNASGDEVLTTARMVREEPLGQVVGIAVGLRSGRGRARLDRERSDLVATVAHELRSPLTGVKGFVQALLNRWDKLTDDQRKLMLETVNADADRLARLIAELLDVARIDTGRLQLYPREVSAEVLVRRVVDSIEAGTARDISLEVEHDLPEVFADPDKFTQVVTNLVENAVRHGQGTGDASGWRLAEALDGRPASRSTTRATASRPSCAGGSSRSSGPPATPAAAGSACTSSAVSSRAHGGWVTIDDAPGGRRPGDGRLAHARTCARSDGPRPPHNLHESSPPSTRPPS